MSVTRASEFDPCLVQVGAVRERWGGGRTVPLLYSNGTRLWVQTPTMLAIFGVISYEEGGSRQELFPPVIVQGNRP